MKQIRQQCRAVGFRLASSLLVLWIGGLVLPNARGADRIILRNLKIVTDRTVAAFDEDGVRLDDAQVLRWDEIEKAKVAPNKQAAFDTMLAALGGHLYRIRQRLTVGDYEGVLPHAEAVCGRYEGRTSDTAYTVFQALMWGRLAVTQREAALSPYLRCYDILRRRDKTEIRLPGERRLLFDAHTALTADITPIWFDASAAKAELPRVHQVIRDMKERPEGVFIYFASLASVAGDDVTAAKVLRAIQSSEPLISELRDIIAAQQEILMPSAPGVAVQRLSDNLDGLSNENLPLALYWLGRHQLASEDLETQQQGLLELLRVPASYGDRHPELAGASLLLAMRKLSEMKDVRGSIALRGELLAEYGSTYSAKRLNDSLTTDRP